MSTALERVAEAVRSKHSDDVIVPECKDGPTHGSNHLRLDYWVMRRSWSRFAYIGYEVKASRADFLQDKKWMRYMPLCHELWFIETERGLIHPEELPETVGLYRLAGSRLVTVRKAVHREIDAPELLLAYVIMCRSTIGREHAGTREERVAWWTEWLADKAATRDLGHRCSKGLRERFEQIVDGVRDENAQLKRERERVAETIALLDANGVPWRTSKWSLENQIRAAPWDRRAIEEARDKLNALLNGTEG